MLGGIEILTVRHPAVNLISNGQCREERRKDTSFEKKYVVSEISDAEARASSRAILHCHGIALADARAFALSDDFLRLFT